MTVKKLLPILFNDEKVRICMADAYSIPKIIIIII